MYHFIGENLLIESSDPTNYNRVLEVVVTNYATRQEITIPNTFDISFDFFATTDEVEQASSGWIKIKNLTKETYDLIATRHQCDVELIGGYESNKSRIFLADIVSCKRSVDSDGINTTTELQVSANYFLYHLSGDNSLSDSNPYSILGKLDDLVRRWFYSDEATSSYVGKIPTIKLIPVGGFTQEENNKLAKQMAERKVGESYSAQGSFFNMMNDFCDQYGLIIDMAQDSNRNRICSISIKDDYVGKYHTWINEGGIEWLKNTNFKSTNVCDTTLIPNQSTGNGVESDKEPIVYLSASTGLIGLPHIDYKVFTVPENYKGLDTDDETQKSLIKSSGDQDKDKTKQEKTGTPTNDKKPNNRKKKQVTKTYLSAEALINPLIQPQTVVNISVVRDTSLNGNYRCRNVNFSGGNLSGDFKMKIYLEDTNGGKDQLEEVDDISPTTDSQDSDNSGLVKDTGNNLQLMVYNAFLSAGFSESQAKALTAEVGREGSYLERNLFGSHTDDKNHVTNTGMISWQGSRRTNLINYLSSRNQLSSNGSLLHSQSCLNAQAEFVMKEMNTGWGGSKSDFEQVRIFLANRNISYSQAHLILGRNYVKWAWDNPKYKPQGDKNRDDFYKKLLNTLSRKEKQQSKKDDFVDSVRNVFGSVSIKQLNSLGK